MDTNCTETWTKNSSEEFCFEVPLVKEEFELLASTNNNNTGIAIECETKLSLTNTQKTVHQKDSKEVVVVDETINLPDNVIDPMVNQTDSEDITILEESELINEIIINRINQDDTANKDKATSEAITVVNDNNHKTISATVNESNPDVVDLENVITDVENFVTLGSDMKDQENIILDGNRTDSDVILLDANKTDSENTIILDDDEISNAASPTSKFVNKDTDCSIIVTKTIKGNGEEYKTIFKENSLLAHLVEKCVNMENAEGMTRVINRTLLPIYKDLKKDYKKSDAMRKMVTKTVMKLELEPERKFSHIKNLCDELKFHRVRKRVPIITLQEKVSTARQSTSSPIKRRKIDTIIELDEDEDTESVDLNENINTQGPKWKKPKEYPPIEIDDDSSDIETNDDDGDIIFICENDKENSKNTSRIKHSETDWRKKRSKLTPKKNSALTSYRNQNNTAMFHNDIKNHQSNLMNTKQLHNEIIRNSYPTQDTVSESTRLPSTSDPQPLLQQSISAEVDRNTEEHNKMRIQVLENKIAALKVKLEIFEETEVTNDNFLSPYLICEQIKSYILNLYKELCELTGTEMTKRHEVRLQVIPGHPEGPVRCLEEFLNNNIDEDGNPPFPDLYDVIGCVSRANVQYNMNWRCNEIMAEARALFTQFGRSMQKRRQQREYRDLMSLVKEEVSDPADSDPELQARLERNKLIGMKNEQVLLERYTQMENGIPDPGLRLSVQQADSDDNSGPENDISSNTAPVVPHQMRFMDPTGPCERTTNVMSMNQVDPRPNFVPSGVSNMDQVGPRPNFVTGGVSILKQVDPRPNIVFSGVSNINQVVPRPNFVTGGVSSMNQVEPNGRLTESNNEITNILQNVNQTKPFVRIQAINIDQTEPFIRIPGMNQALPIIGGINYFQHVGGNKSMNWVQPNGGVISNMNQFVPIAIRSANQTESHDGVTVNVNQLAPGGSIMTINQIVPIGDIGMNQITPKGISMNINHIEFAGGISMNQGVPIGTIRVDNPEPGGVTPLNTNAKLVTGSSLTVAGGNIIIAPTVKYATDANSSHNYSQINMFTGGSKRTLNVKANLTQTSKRKPNHKHKSNVLNTIDSANISGHIGSIRLENERRNATALAKDFVNPIQNCPNDDSNGFANVIISNVQSVNGLTEGATEAADEYRNDKTQTDGLQDTTHTAISLPTVNADTETFMENVAISEKENKAQSGGDTYLENIESLIKPKSLQEESDEYDPEVPKDTCHADSTIRENIEKIVKPEPLDIPSMLEELGDDYTATIFDIEDPFLVIEISDSSESEEDERDII